MSLAITASFTAQSNLVVILAQSSTKNGAALRVASTGSGTIGTLTASGTATSAAVTWSLTQNPSWLTLSVDPTSLIATLAFSNAQAQTNPYQFVITANDGTTTVSYPVFLEVKDPLSLVATTGATSFSIPSYDSSSPDIVFQGIGLNGVVETDVQFIPPVALPSGMMSITSDGSAMTLRVAPPSATDVSGGIALFTGSPVATQVTLQAYCPGTMYDTPDLCCTQDITIESLTAQQGTLDLGLSVDYNTTLNAFSLTSYLDFLEGQATAVTYQWLVTGTATGDISSGGTGSDTTMVWMPATVGTAGFTLNVLNASSGVVIGQAVVAPIPCAPSGAWNATDALKIEIGAPDARGYTGSTPTVTVSTPAAELNTNETITVTFSVSTGSALETAATVTETTVTLTATTPTATVGITLPESSFNEKWVIEASAANAATNPTRTGYAQVVVLSNGDQPLIITSTGGATLTSNVGQNITPIQLTASSSTGTVVSTAVFSLEGAPAGLSISPTGQLIGNALIPGVYTFSYVASAAGYATSYSAPITLTASSFLSPLVITGAVPSVTSVPDGTSFNVTWGYTGTATVLNMIQGFTVTSVIGLTEITTSEVGNSVITVYGSSFFGTAYSIPALVLSSSVTAMGDLPDAPTVGTIDQDYNLTLQWNPLTVDGTYLAYRAWDIYLSQPPNGVPQLQSIGSSLPTGLEDTGSTQASRIYETTLTSGDWQVTMQALTANPAVAANSLGWPEPLEFPTTLTSALVSFDNSTVSLGQTVTTTLSPTYTGADSWQAIYPDGTTSGWMPMSARSLAKVMNVAGDQTIIIQTLYDYSTSTPPAKLMRQVSMPIYVMNQQYITTTASSLITGDLGIGGTSGFEVTDASSGAVALQPYEVVVRGLVRDVLSNELKLMVATSRTSNASSLLGTMAIDVFPIQGRPRVKDLVDPALYLSAEMVPPGNPVQIATTALPNLIVGSPMTDFPMQVGLNSGVAPFSWYADNLPFGITLSTNGTLTGTAMTIGTTSCDFAVVDSNVPPFIAHTTLTFTVESNLKITTTTVPQAVVGTPYNFEIINTGGIPPFTWSMVAGNLPIGLSIDPETGYIVGTPCTYNSTTDFNKTFSFTVEVQDAIGALASAALTCTLAPAALQFGPIDQPEIFPADSFELTVPIFGGSSPYTLVGFSDDGTIGTGLQIANPSTIAAVAGVAPMVLAVTTTAQEFFPPSNPANLTIPLTAQGGVAPYIFSVVSGANTTLPYPAVFGNILTAEFTGSGNGFYTVEVEVTDSIGTTASSIIQVEVQQQNVGSTGGYSIKPIMAATNGSTNPTNFTITPIAALPDATNGAAYNAGSGVYYGLALYSNNVLMMSQPAGSSIAPMNFSIREGALPTGIVAFAGNSFGAAGDFSGLELFNVSGGQNATANGSYSFQAEFSNINTAGWNNPISPGAGGTVVSRESITVTTAGGGTTPVVVVTSGASAVLAPAGSVDSHYTLTSSADPSYPGPSVYVVAPDAPWISAVPGSQWVGPSVATATVGNSPGNYTYTTTFDLTGMDSDTAVLSGIFAADDSAVIVLNGVQLPNVTTGYNVQTPFAINSGFVVGVNTLQFVVTNANLSLNPTGLMVSISGSAMSPSGELAIGVFGTGVVSVVSDAFAVNITTATATNGYYWHYPLTAEGGTAPYTFNILGGTTLSGCAVTTLNGLPALVSATTTAGVYEVIVSASDANGVISAPAIIEVTLNETTTQPVTIVSSNLPTSIYAGRALAANQYYIESDLISTFTASDLPPGITLSTGPGTFGYLSGTPTTTGTFDVTLTATSVVYNTTARATSQMVILPQTATFINAPTSAIVGTNYRVVTNNAILFVQYAGYLPSDASFPLPTSKNGTVGSPSVQVSGTATTGVSNLTATGFVMAFDYFDAVYGTDTITLGNGLATLSLPVNYPAIVATGKTVSLTVSEYAATATFAPPVTVTGGLAPYTITPTGFSDSSFTALNGQIVATVDELPVGATTACTVTMLIVDSSGNSTTATGTLQLTVQQANYITVDFSNATWGAPVSTGAPFTISLIPNQLQSVPVLGHTPYQYYVDSVVIPTALAGFVQVSPSNRVLAINCNASNTSASIYDVNSSLVSSGSFIVAAVAPPAAPAVGTYTITAALRVVDADNLVASQTVNIVLTIS